MYAYLLNLLLMRKPALKVIAVAPEGLQQENQDVHVCALEQSFCKGAVVC